VPFYAHAQYEYEYGHEKEANRYVEAFEEYLIK